MLSVLDLFSGIGGFSLGLEAAGCKTAAFCEIEPFCRELLAERWPGVKIYDDVRTLTAERLAADGISVDAICGGFPCQDISYAGLGAGLAGERSGLWFEYARLIGELGPSFVFVENVSALLSRGLDAVLGTLAALGYDAEWHCIPASAIGAHHRRDRLWLVAYPSSERRGEARRLRQQPAERLAGCGEIQAAIPDASSERREKGRSLLGQPAKRLAERGEISDAMRGGRRQGRARRPDALRQDRPGAGEQAARIPDADRARLADGREGGNPRGPSAPIGQIIFPELERRRFTGWPPEPPVRRMVDGVSAGLDAGQKAGWASRIKGLGNAVVPEIPEIIARAALQRGW